MKSILTKENILSRIQKLNIDKNVLNFKTLYCRDEQLANDVLQFTNFLPKSAKLRERLYCIENDIKTQQLCPQCHKNILQFVKGKYRLFCSIKCLNSSKYHKQHCEETTLKRFGVRHHCQSVDFQNEQKKRNLEKYGVDYAFQAKNVIEKCKQTKQQHIEENPNYWKDREEKAKQTKIKNGHNPNWRNIEQALQTKKDNLKKNPHFYDESNAKRIQICIEKYGSAVNSEKIKKTKYQKSIEDPDYYTKINKKTRKTKLEKYGSETYVNVDKCKQTKLKRYGSETYNNSEKNRNTSLARYGVENCFQLDEIKKKIAFANAKISYENFILNNEYDEPLFSLDEYSKRIDEHDFLKFKCKKCGYEFEAWHHDGHHQHCPKCYPKQISNPERELVEFVRTFGIDFKTNDRLTIKPLELDIYIPKKKLAIEFDGLFWHSENDDKQSNYHLKKTELCEKQGIQLIHIFENEWIYKQDIVKSRLKNLLGIYDKTIYARKCEIIEIDSKTSKDFQEQNHIQGAVNSSINLGLYFENELISLMTFGKSRFNKKYEWELLRFCNKLNYHIPGAAGKLLKYFERNYHPKSIISYADRRWSQGKLYKALNFTLDHISKPDYWYWKTLNLESRLKFQKHKLKNLLENYDENKTEFENMKNNGYYRIYDCGNLVFVKNFKIV